MFKIAAVIYFNIISYCAIKDWSETGFKIRNSDSFLFLKDLTRLKKKKDIS